MNEPSPTPQSTSQPQRVLDYVSPPAPTAGPERAGLSSFVCGLLFFIPFVTQFYAIALGLIALCTSKESDDPSGNSDRGFAIAGLWLGVAACLWWIRNLLVLFGVR